MKLAAAVGLLLAAGAAAAEPYVDPHARFQLVLPDGWQIADTAGAPAEVLLAAAAGPRDLLVVTRLAGPTEGTNAELEASVARAAGGRLVSARWSEAPGKVRVLDARVRRGRVVTHARLLLRAASATVLVVEARSERVARRITRGFGPAR